MAVVVLGCKKVWVSIRWATFLLCKNKFRKCSSHFIGASFLSLFNLDRCSQAEVAKLLTRVFDYSHESTLKGKKCPWVYFQVIGFSTNGDTVFLKGSIV